MLAREEDTLQIEVLRIGQRKGVRRADLRDPVDAADLELEPLVFHQCQQGKERWLVHPLEASMRPMGR